MISLKNTINKKSVQFCSSQSNTLNYFLIVFANSVAYINLYLGIKYLKKYKIRLLLKDKKLQDKRTKV